MLRRAVALLVVAGTAALVFWIARSGGRGGQSGPDPIPAAPLAQEPDPEPPTLSSSDPGPLREEVRPSKAPKKRTHGEPVPAKAAEPAATSGRVVDDLGAPVRTFSIEARCITNAASGKRRPKPIERSFESKDGSFVLDELSPGQWELAARTADGRRSAEALVTVPEEGGKTELVIPRSATLSGSVVARGGAPVPGAKVYLHYADEQEFDFSSGDSPEPRTRTDGTVSTFSFGGPPPPRARTDERGIFLIEGVAPGTVEIMARHPEFADCEWRKLAIAPGALATGVVIELSEGGRIEGLADPSLGDVVDREIGLFSFRGLMGWRQASTDPTGRFVIEHVMPLDYVIDLYPAGYGKPENRPVSPEEPSIRKNITVKEGQTTQVVFAPARRSIAVHGLVLAGRAPAAGWDVRPYSEENEDRGEKAKSGSDGRFELTLSGPGEYWFQLSEHGKSGASILHVVPEQDDVDVLLELPSGELSGRVMDLRGRPLAGIGITLVQTDCSRDVLHRHCYHCTRTESGGKFHFRLLEPGAYTLRAPDGYTWDSPPPRWPYGRSMLTDLVIGGAEVAGIELRLPEEGRIAGDVVDGRGNPVTNAWVGALDRTGIPLAGMGWDTRADGTGHFEIGNVAPGTYSVRVRAAEQEARSPPFEIAAGETASVRIELR